MNFIGTFFTTPPPPKKILKMKYHSSVSQMYSGCHTFSVASLMLGRLLKRALKMLKKIFVSFSCLCTMHFYVCMIIVVCEANYTQAICGNITSRFQAEHNLQASSVCR